MYKTITKNLIYLAIAMVTMPVGAVMAQDNTEELEVLTNEVALKPNVETVTKITNVKNVIDETLASRVVVKKQQNNVQRFSVNNSRDWSGSKYTKEQIMAKICQVFKNNCQEALIIAKHESGFRPWAISSTNDWGVFQLNCKWQKRRVGGDCRRFLDPDTNIRIAKQIYDEQGWNPWTTKRYL